MFWPASQTACFFQTVRATRSNGKLCQPDDREIAETGLPVFGICIGHQLIAEAFGASTYKMGRGHRGANHRSGSDHRQDRDYQPEPKLAVDQASLDALEVTHVSLFDGSVEGLRHRDLPVFSVQYHPDPHPGPMIPVISSIGSPPW